MISKSFLVSVIVVLLSACTGPQTLYDWGQYEQTLFIHYHDPALKEQALKEYIAFIEQGGTQEHPIAPGLYAEAGTFMLEQGDIESAVKFYQMEHDAWPESRPMLSVLIENLEGQIDG
ncbi:DUF4810 domain-containing protein [Marinimicrobium locisalis]|uniref:DUF4810 domain-containing protein n=1 Tax=Marinimicrobium locisalis TaxID=546022 RepID=UPI00322198A3